MTLSVAGVAALTTKGIEAKGGVRDAIFKNHAYAERLRMKQGVYAGEKLTFPFNYYDDTQTTGRFYQGAQSLSLDIYDPYTELSFDLIELEETLVITHRDLAKNSGKEARLKLIEQRLKSFEQAMTQRMTKGLFSDGTVSTGALSSVQFPGQAAFLKSSSVDYGNVTDTDVSVHVAYVEDNSSVNRSVSTALWQQVFGGASEGNKKPSLVICRQNTMNEFVELLKPHQRTTRDASLDGLGHAKNTLVYSGVDHIVDNLSIANAMSFINEDHCKLYSHPEYDMKLTSKDDLEGTDAILRRLFWKGVYAADVLRFQGILKDLSVAS